MGAVLLPKEVVRLVKKYKKDGGHNNTKSIWFSLIDLIKVIGQVTSLDNPDLKKEGDGVRIYLAKTTKKHPKPERNTIVFVPTYNLNNGSIHYDFLSAEEVGNLSQEIGDPDDGVGFNTAGYDHGELCPETCEGTTVGNLP